MKHNTDFQTTAVSRAARGTLNVNETGTRATTVYGFKDRALNLSGEELRAAWKVASSAVRKK